MDMHVQAVDTII